MHYKNRERLVLLISVGWLFLLAWILMVAAVGFLLGFAVDKYHLVIALVLSVVSLGVFSWRLEKKTWLIMTLLALMISAVLGWGCLKVAGKYVDQSYDGTGYHSLAINNLSAGWNPVHERLESTASPGESWWSWVNAYPKGAEIIEATFYQAGGNFEMAKGVNIMTSLMALGFVWSFLRRLKKFNKYWVGVLSLLVVLAPVNVTEWLTFYNDGLMYSILVSLMAVLCMAYLDRDLWLVPVGVLMALLWNIKMTGIVYGLVATLVVLVMALIKKRYSWVKRAGTCLFVGSLLGGIIWGYNPYITNWRNEGNPFYFPVSMAEIVRNNVPTNLVMRTPVERLLISAFSKSSGVRGQEDGALLKIPFTYSRLEVEAFGNPDILVGGWGPLFGAGLAFGLLIWWLMVALDVEKAILRQTSILVVVILLTCVVNGAASYARYVPQLWLVPLITAGEGIRTKNKLIRILAMMTVSVMIANTGLILSVL